MGDHSIPGHQTVWWVTIERLLKDSGVRGFRLPGAAQLLDNLLPSSQIDSSCLGTVKFCANL